MIDWTSPQVHGAIGAALTPIVIAIWKRLFPVSSFSEFDHVRRDDLKRRNNWIDWIATLVMFLGLASWFVPYSKGLPTNDPIGAALGFGLMMWLPASFILIVTLPRGLSRFREFLWWYELKWGIGIRGIAYVYVPLFVFAAAALIYAFRRLVV